MQLYGKSRREAVSFLKEVPPPFTLVCCRRLFDDEASVDEPRTTEAPLPKMEVLTEYSMVPTGTRFIKNALMSVFGYERRGEFSIF